MPVDALLSNIELTVEEFLENFPTVTREQALQVLGFPRLRSNVCLSPNEDPTRPSRMTHEDEQWCQVLDRARALATDQDFEDYQSACEALPKSDDPDLLRRMLVCLDDREAGEVQYELVEACERFSTDVYVTVVVSEAESGLLRSPQWFGMILQSLLNGEDYLQSLFKKMRDTPTNSPTAVIAFVRGLATEPGENVPRYRLILDEMVSIQAEITKREAG